MMRTFIKKNQARNWFVIEFSKLGFIGKMFKVSELSIAIQFFLTFFKDKPVDWLLSDIIYTKVCSPEMNAKMCNLAARKMRIQYGGRMFVHIGTHSSLEGKVWNKKGKKIDEASLFKAHKNPPATIETTMMHYKDYSIEKAYLGENFYWGLVPKESDYITFTLTPPVELDGVKFVSGNMEHPSDRFVETTVEILFENSKQARQKQLKSLGYRKIKDGFLVVARFDAKGLAMNLNLTKLFGKVKAIRLKVRDANSKNWVILSDIEILAKRL